MKYLGSVAFSAPRAAKVMAGTCERCVFNSGLHAAMCSKRIQRVDANTYIDWNLWIPLLEGNSARVQDSGPAPL